MENCGKVERPQQAIRACSACAGDYEDPERTAWTDDDEDGKERDVEALGDTDEFPAEE